jgi:hypothetical protein
MASAGLHLASRQDEVCDLTGFDANVDFYGFGVRLGVYLQWFSSYISNSLDPESASENHEENSIFVLAIAIALAIVFQTDELRVSEMYILLLICTGYFCLVVSTWGLRLHLLRPGTVRVSPLLGQGVDMRRSYTADSFISRLPGSAGLSSIATQYFSPRQIPLSQGGSVKPTGLSWAGAVWRSSIATFVLVLNLCLWLSYSPDSEARPGCEPTIYFFGAQKLDNQLQTFFIVMCFLAGSIVVQLIFAMFNVVYFLLLKLVIGPLLDMLGLNRMKEFLNRRMALKLFVADHSGLLDTENVTLEHTKAAIFALCAQKESPGVQPHVHPPRHPQHEGYRLSMTLVLCWHAILLAMMGCFIAFIEQTIQINDIRGAFVLRSTSQLIPFIIGLISMLNTIRQLFLQWYEEDHGNQDNIHFVLVGSLSQLSIFGLFIEGFRWLRNKPRHRPAEVSRVANAGDADEFDLKNIETVGHGQSVGQSDIAV